MGSYAFQSTKFLKWCSIDPKQVSSGHGCRQTWIYVVNTFIRLISRTNVWLELSGGRLVIIRA